MYTAFYGLREKPFALLPDPRYLFLAESHREALAHLLYGIDQGEGFIAVTGEVGTGKTTICRTLLERLGSETEVAFLFNPSRSGVELLQDISAEFGLDSARRSRSELGVELNRFLLRKKQEHRRVLLIIDEAQNLSHDTLEQVRLLSNLETSSSKLIQILLLGQPELDQKLDSPQLRQLRQRISVRWGLKPLSAKETHDYVRHRLRVAAGADRSIFNDAALREIHRRSRGVPRIVNVLCDRALLAGYVARAATVGPALVKKVAREIPEVQRRAIFARGRSRSSRSKIFGIGAALALAFVGGWAIALGLPGWERSERWDGVGGIWRSEYPGSSTAPAVAGTSDVASAPPIERLAAELIDASIESLTASSWQTLDETIAWDPPAPTSTDLGETSEPVSVGEVAESDDVPAEVPASPATHASLAPEPSGRASAEALAPEMAFAPGRVLAAVVAAEDPGLTRLESLNAVLDSFGLARFDDSPRDIGAMLDRLRQRGLAVLNFERADLASLLSLNHPALLRVVGDDQRMRILALMRLDGGRAHLYGLASGGPLRVPLDELEQQWRGGAWVVWNDFEALRPMLAFGEKGSAVAWLQKSLAELGYYDGEASGLFDRSTSEGLRAFQQSWKLQVDGVAGPRTRMVLYDLLDGYRVPSLVDRRSRSEDAG